MAKRGKGNQIGLYIIVGLICVAMLGFGTGQFGGTVSSIGTVGDREIGTNRYFNAIRQQIRQVSQQIGQPVTFAQLQEFGQDQAALQQLISTVSLEAEASALGLSVGDSEVRAEILRIPAFQGLDGQFDREAYSANLRHSGSNERDFENDLRAEISRTIVQSAVLSGIETPEAYTEALMQFVGERRNFAWARLGAEDLAAPVPEPTEAEARAYFDANEDAFMLPETRDISYVWITPAMLAPSIAVSEEDARALYEERIDEFVTPERRLVERLILGSAAETDMARIEAEELTFDELVAERGLELTDIDLGDVTEADLGSAGAGVFALEELGLAGPLDTDLGPALFRVNAILTPQETTFEDARAGLEAELAAEDAVDQIAGMIENVDDLLVGGATLEEVASETDLELAQLDWALGAAGGIADNATFRSAAAAAEVGDFPEIADLGDGGIFALRINEVIAPRLEDFADARPRAEAAWLRQATVDALAAQAETMAEGLRGGQSAEALGVTLTEQTDITRESFLPDTSVDFIEQVFEMEKGTVAVIPGDNAVQIVRLDDVLPPDPADNRLTARRQLLADAMSRGLSTDILVAYARAVQENSGISLNQAAINAVNVQIP
ncbi:Peptidyl-prolyl cis-trans isomerase PpiD [Candidatus Rhodobacter oscarellae]|uniref:Peptidyl-prolyl cis-trans isomerase PpiD n=1 Tax=Candidatus Rhodobacter oscarellae TaxID=1675527 RepID=A0A0J9E1V9_9RHOB|nr:peptidylprolyl isomerase [Candidatus Rhodobacter lobularis]KMW56677.1 Peptidyl-prolyl cis-trans isomerase PpiD [Candidatus Rhodobacter lobularis]